MGKIAVNVEAKELKYIADGLEMLRASLSAKIRDYEMRTYKERGGLNKIEVEVNELKIVVEQLMCEVAANGGITD